MPAERAPLPPTTILLLRLYAHLLRWPLDAHSPSQLIKDVPELKSNTLHTRMDILEQAGLLVSGCVALTGRTADGRQGWPKVQATPAATADHVWNARF